MNYAAPAGLSPMLSQDMALLKELFDKLKGFLQESVHALDHMDRATSQGEALDQLRERIFGSHIGAEICLAVDSNMLYRSKNELSVRVVTSEPLPLEVQFHIHQMLAAVNLRYAITIRAEFLSRHKK